MEKTITIKDALATLYSSVPNTEPRKFVEGKVMQQGDIYIHPVPDSHPRGPNMGIHRQLAVGETKGSRHMVEGDVEVFVGTKVPPGVNDRIPLGPLFVVKSGTASIPHPEHPAWINIPVGTYQVTHQVNALTGERVND